MSTEPNTTPPGWIRTIAAVGLALSLVAVMAGGIWSAVAKPEHVWSEQQARELKAATEALHATLATGHTHGHGPAESGHAAEAHAAGTNETRQKAEQRLATIQAELEAAQYAKNRAGLLLVQVGVAGAACCGALLLLTGDR